MDNTSTSEHIVTRSSKLSAFSVKRLRVRPSRLLPFVSCSTPLLKLRSQRHVHYTSYLTMRRKLPHLGETTLKSARQICSSVSSTTTDDGEGTQYALTPPSPQQAPGLSRAASAIITKSPNSSPMTFKDKEKIPSFLLGVGNADAIPATCTTQYVGGLLCSLKLWRR